MKKKDKQYYINLYNKYEHIVNTDVIPKENFSKYKEIFLDSSNYTFHKQTDILNDNELGDGICLVTSIYNAYCKQFNINENTARIIAKNSLSLNAYEIIKLYNKYINMKYKDKKLTSIEFSRKHIQSQLSKKNPVPLMFYSKEKEPGHTVNLTGIDRNYLYYFDNSDNVLLDIVGAISIIKEYGINKIMQMFNSDFNNLVYERQQQFVNKNNKTNYQSVLMDSICRNKSFLGLLVPTNRKPDVDFSELIRRLQNI